LIMDCERCILDLTAYQDGELSAADTAELKSHLDVCAPCAAEFRSLQRAATLVDLNTDELQPRPETWNLVKEQITASQISPSPWRRPFVSQWRIAAAILVVAMALTIGYNQYRHIQKRSLEKYIAQYIQEREAYKPAQVIPASTGMDPNIKDPNTANPFIDIRDTQFRNPFRSEDR
jgi:hypothetical protein